MENFYIEIKTKLLEVYKENIWNWIIEFLPKILWAFLWIIFWIIIAIITYKLIMYLFKKFKIIELVDKITMTNYFENANKKKNKLNPNKKTEEVKIEEIKEQISSVQKMSDKIKIDRVTAKSSAYYIFLLCFRWAIQALWITEVEKFLTSLTEYLPTLFIAAVIWFFGIRFADFMHDVALYTLEIADNKIAKIIASWVRIIMLFFIVMIVLAKVWIAEFITNTILIGFVTMVSIAWWLAFWLGWKELAKDILESLKK